MIDLIVVRELRKRDHGDYYYVWDMQAQRQLNHYPDVLLSVCLVEGDGQAEAVYATLADQGLVSHGADGQRVDHPMLGSVTLTHIDAVQLSEIAKALISNGGSKR